MSYLAIASREEHGVTIEMNFDVIVVGAGHAGAEAAWAASHLDCTVALVTIQLDSIGAMSCNPAIGGLGKGQMVREIDALGGLMGLAADWAGIQFRVLNRSKGHAVRAPRAQADRRLYHEAVSDLLHQRPNIKIIEGMVEQLHATDPDQGDGRRRITGVTLSDGRQLHASEVILTTGTFLRGLMHCGSDKTEGGRIGEPAAVTLSKSLNSLGLRLARLKTGTPPRVHRDSVRLSDLEAQPGDPAPPPFSFMNCHIDQKQVHCWITHTNERTHDILRSNINRAPLYSGQIQSCGPRYCPSIEDKIMRFADKPSHQVFLEPEGYDNPWLYCNGISTSTPRDVQDAMVHSIVGLEDACIEQYGYAIEYDWVPTDQIWPTLETKAIAGLSLAGQINGTSGYEEAAAQGLIAGANAALRLRSADPIVLGRDEAYIGVMIDDIVTRPPDEPYRMFTSRAEYRLHLRSDNADIRLTPRGRSIGLVDDGRWWRFEQKTTAIAALREALKQCRHNGQSLLDCLRKPGTSLLDLIAGYPELASLAVDHEVIEAVEIETKYAGYLAREQRQIDRHRQQERLQIPENCDFQSISTLRREARERLARVRPRSLGQAARMTGISPADIATLSVHLFSKKSAT